MPLARLHQLALTPLLLVPALFAATPASGQAADATAQEQAVLAPVQALFAGMARRDTAAILKTALPGATMVLMRDGKPTQFTLDAFAQRLGKPSTTRIEERIRDPLIRIDHDLAVVWAPFTFLVDGHIDHCGTDLFNLVRQDGQWLIASVADTGTKSCPAP